MRLLSLISLVFALPLPSFVVAEEPELTPAPVPAVNPLISCMAFGSCSNQEDPLPILRTVLEREPDLFVYLGDKDAGKEFPFKADSKEIFLKFWNKLTPSPCREHEGIYISYRFEDPKLGKRLQIILLDTRTFRDQPLRALFGSWRNDYLPDTNPNKTVLSDTQWEWLRARLEELAGLRIIGSSIQFGHQHNGWESWTNFPLELIKFVDLI